MKQKEYTGAFLREGEAPLSLTGRKILSGSSLVCRKSGCVTQVMQLNRLGAVGEKICRPPWRQSEGDSTDSFSSSNTFSILHLVAYRSYKYMQAVCSHSSNHKSNTEKPSRIKTHNPPLSLPIPQSFLATLSSSSAAISLAINDNSASWTLLSVFLSLALSTLKLDGLTLYTWYS